MSHAHRNLHTGILNCLPLLLPCPLGVTIAAAAGNYGRSIKSFVPALCPTVLSVTSLDQDATAPADWSDFADAADASQKAHTIAAPGTGIVSTVPKSVDPSGYLELGGTSMVRASPRAALCIKLNCTSHHVCMTFTTSTSLELYVSCSCMSGAWHQAPAAAPDLHCRPVSVQANPGPASCCSRPVT